VPTIPITITPPPPAPDHGADDRTDQDRSRVTSACPYPVGKPAGAGRTRRDAASAEANEPTHRPFPQETTDFLGQPGTNH